MVFGLPAHDPATMGAVVLVLLATAMVASLVPALRVARIAPVEALKAA
jgi:ABC-type antimicrobial peptide transport system permease subunit